MSLSKPPEPWFVSAFRADYLRVYPHRDLDAARAEARHLAAEGLLAEPILDLGAGFGRHTLALRELGLSTFGVDLSLELLRASRELKGSELLRGRLARGDARRLPFADGSLRTVLMLFSSFGYFDDEGNRGVLQQLRRTLAPGGRAVLDLMNPARVRAALVPSSRRQAADFELSEERRFSGDGRRVIKDVTLRDARGERAWREDVRLYEPEELDRLCGEVGFAVERRDGDFGERAFDARSPRQIVWLRRDSPAAA